MKKDIMSKLNYTFSLIKQYFYLFCVYIKVIYIYTFMKNNDWIVSNW